MEMRKLLDLVENKSYPSLKRSLDSLTDEELEWAIDGTTDLNMVRILARETATEPNGTIDVDDFGDWFADEISGFIAADADEDPEGWREAYEGNREWGENIAASINELLTGETVLDNDEDESEEQEKTDWSKVDLSQGWPPVKK